MVMQVSQQECVDTVENSLSFFFLKAPLRYRKGCLYVGGLFCSIWKDKQGGDLFPFLSSI